MYFKSFPLIVKDNILLTDIVTRLKIHDHWLTNDNIYYDYTFKDSDKIEDIASKYYGSSFDHWIIIITNNIFDAFFDLPLDYRSFLNYVNDKYYEDGQALIPTRNGIEYAQITLHPIFGYKKIVQINDYYDPEKVLSKKTYTIDLLSYANLYSEDDQSFVTITLKNGNMINYKTYRDTTTIYDWEVEENDKKRFMKILKKEYYPIAKKELIQLLAQY